MMQVTEQLIRNLYYNSFFTRGKNYYLRGNVQNLMHDANSNTWHADVKGGSIYQTRVTIKEDHIEDYCDCLAYPTYGQCKHICATLLAIANAGNQAHSPRSNKDSFFENRSSKNARYQQAEDLIGFFGKDIPEQRNVTRSSKSVLKTQFLLRTYTADTMRRQKEVFDIQLKIGDSRLYVVKDIRELLDAVTMDRKVKFGKNFTFDPALHTFTAEDQDVIDDLIEIKRTESYYDTNNDYWSPARKGKELLIPPYASDDLLFKLQHLNCRYEQQHLLYNQLELVTESLPFSFSLEGSTSEEYQLKVTGSEVGWYYDAYGWYAEDGKLYKLSEAQKQSLQPFNAFMGKGMKPAIPISKDQMSAFISATLPKMKQIGEITVSEEVSETILSPPLTVKLFVDGSYNSVDVNVEYHYDSVIINPLNETEKNPGNTEKILIRDNAREQEFMNALEDSSLKVIGNKFYADTDEDQFEFLHETLPVLEELAEIYLTSSVKSVILPTPPKPAVSVDAPTDGNFLHVDFTMEGIDPEEISNILTAVKEKRRYVRLADGAFLPLMDDQLVEIAELHHELGSKAYSQENGTMELPLYRGLQVEEQLAELNWDARNFSSSFHDFFTAIKNPVEEDIQIPPGLNADLRDYQETGFKWLKSLSKYGLGGILADDMGLGKTIQCIAYILSEMDDGSEKPFLIVAPASLVYNWKNEFHRFAPDLRVDIAAGTVKEREAVLTQEDKPDVYITSYHTLRQDVEWYRDQTFHALIMDEAQAIKNYQTKIAQAVRTLTASRRFALSGTPVENSLDELWAVFQAVMPGFLYDQKTFRNTPPETIARLVKPFILRRLKEDVLTELPDKIETVHYSELNKDQKTLYLAYLDKIQKETQEALATEGINKGRLKILAGLTRLRQLCCHPSLFIDEYDGGSGKLEALFEIIENAQANGQRMLIFSQFPSMLRIIREKLKQSGQSCYYLDGKTPGAERVRLVESYNEGEESIFLISLKAGGTGLNLTGADTVVLYDLWWNPAIEEQAIGRAHRMGQKNVVQVIRMIAQGTIEEKINELQQQKKEMIDQIIQPGEAMLSSMSEDDIREILSI